MQIAAPIIVSFADLDGSQHPSVVPDTPGVYAFVSGARIVHVGWSSHLAGRLGRMLSKKIDGTGTLGSRMQDAGYVLQCWPTASKLESSLVMYHVVKANSPRDYRERLRLRLPWFLTFTLRDPFPRLILANRFPSGQEPVIGPFQSRDSAQQYADEVLGLFPLRRCIEPLKPHPDHPGCLYGEMNQCLRPCQAAVSEADYRGEIRVVTSFLLTNGKSSLDPAIAAREEAANAMDFERAAQLHRQIGKIKEAGKGREELVGDARGLSGVAVTKGASEDELRFWPMLNGNWQECRTLRVDADDSVEAVASRLRELLESAMANPTNSGGDPAEHLAILTRWYHSSWRDGAWYPLSANGTLSYRRMARSMMRSATPRPT